jgi:hypothetical protein
LIQPDSFNWGWGRDQQRIVYEKGAKKRERERDQVRTRGIASTSVWKYKTWARRTRRRSGG